MIQRNSGRNLADVKRWLKERYGVASSADLTRDVYDEVCRLLEAPGPLSVRMPGED
jgi:hypothetical protein